jgi:hypothetical protein
MKYMVEFRLKPGLKNEVVDLFELRGPNRHPGVAFRGAWIGSQSDLVFILCESEDPAAVERACKPWLEHGDFTLHPVVDVEQF